MLVYTLIMFIKAAMT